MSKSKLEQSFLYYWRVLAIENGYPELTEEFKFHPKRLWRTDFALPDYMILIELEGGVWTRGRHTRGSGYIKDLEKYNAANELGFTLLRYHKANEKAVKQVMRVIDKVEQDAA